MSRAVPRRVLFALLLLPLAGLLAWWSSYRTKIEIQGTDAGLRLIVNDQAVDVPGKVGHLRGFRIVPSGGLFATSAGTVRVQGPFNEREDYPMPRRLHYGATDVPYTADWWIDYGRSGPDEIIRQQTSMPEPWKLSFTFHGRGRGMVVVEGDRDLTCGFRVGGIDNDLLVQDQKGVRLGGSALHPKWRLDLRHLLQWPAAGVFMACVLILLFALSAN